MPDWLVVLSITSLAVCGASAVVIVVDLVVTRPRIMRVMWWVWPVNALYLGPLAVWAYWTMGRPKSDQERAQAQQSQSLWKIVFKATTHCGTGCTLGDVVAEWTVFLAGWHLLGRLFWPEIAGDYALAYLLGIAFQYFTIAPMRKLGVKDGVAAAVKADTLSLTAFEVGLFGWMALMAFVFFHPPIHPDTPVYWFLMQVGMAFGFATSYPMNWWLVERGLKERM